MREKTGAGSLAKSRHARFKIILEGSMKKLFVLFLCLAAVAGFVWAEDYRPPGAPALEMTGYGVGCEAVVPDTVLAVASLEAVELICLWADQYQEGLLKQGEFKTLVAGRIAVMRMRDQTLSEGMKALAEKTRKKVDRLLMCRELKLGIQHPGSLPGGWCAIAH
jgi:hypothetical protein